MPFNASDEEPVFAIYPSTGTYPCGEQVEVEVWIEDVVDLYGVDVELSYDSTVITVADSNPNQAGIQITPSDDLISPDFILINEVDPSEGTIHYVVSQVYPSDPVSGSGILFSFVATMSGPGDANILVSENTLSNQYGSEYSISAMESHITSTCGFEFIYFPLIVVSSP